MSRTPEVGLFGKLPAHGDFIYRNLPSHFINGWDAWLQGFVANSQQELGEQWLDTYLTSPIWRFALSDGIFDNSHWLGIVLPSVDRVGRYFPFSIAARVQTPTCAFSLLEQGTWLNAVEELALGALHGQIRLDDLAVALAAVKLNVPRSSARTTTNLGGMGTALKLDTDGLCEQPIGDSYPQMLDALMRSQAPTYSLWSTLTGSERVTPVLAATSGMPNLRSTTALLDGNWSDSGWSLRSEPHLTEPQPA